MNCRACHLVDEHTGSAGNRTYADFARRSPLPERGDGLVVTPRNAPALVNAALPRKNFLLHFDGEFATTENLVRETFLGRNFGWLPSERAQALAHVAHVIRKDDGHGTLAQAFGGAYRVCTVEASGTVSSAIRRRRSPTGASTTRGPRRASTTPFMAWARSPRSSCRTSACATAIRTAGCRPRPHVPRPAARSSQCPRRPIPR
jgi:hypothetical protein